MSPTQDSEKGQANLRTQGSLPEPSLQTAFLGPNYIITGEEEGASLTGTHCMGCAGATPCRSLGEVTEMEDSLPEKLRTEGLHAGRQE